MPVTRVYIDGFNLYHGIIRPHRLHWLNLAEFAQRLNWGLPVDKIIYCTAMVSSTPSDPQKAQRQDSYHRALAIACPTVEIVKGQFTRHKKLQPLAGCASAPTCAIRVWVRTEKGSDVNLAARLLHDAHTNKYDRAIVVSGDSDLAEPIRLVTADIGKAVWVRNPRDIDSDELTKVASNYSRIRADVLKASQLPNVVTDGTSSYHKPAKWSLAPQPLTKNLILSTPCPHPGCTNSVTTLQYR
jgi:hypothetical protein